jgi:altronate dehydratase
MRQAGIDPEDYGWASIQLDGGIQPVMAKIAAWFAASSTTPERQSVGLEQVRLGLVTDGRISEKAAVQLAKLAVWIVSAGGTVIVPENDRLLGEAAFLTTLKLPDSPEPTLRYACRPVEAGLHIMQRPSTHWSETMTGLGATGVEVMLALVEKRPLSGHPFIPVLQAAEETAVVAAAAQDLDILLQDDGDHPTWAESLHDLVLAALSGSYVPSQDRQENVDFQITRGLLGVSL